MRISVRIICQSPYTAAQLGTADMIRAVLIAAVLAAASSFAPVTV